MTAPAAPALSRYTFDGSAFTPLIPNDATTLLSYAIQSTPDPLTVSTGGTLMLVISNPGRLNVTVSSIVVTINLGTNAKDLYASADTIKTQPPSGWNFDVSGGVLTITPQSGTPPIGAAGLTFLIYGVVNDQPGTTAITIDETVVLPQNAGSVEHTTSIPAPKFPAQWSLSTLTASPYVIPYDGSTTLMWTGSAAEYSIEYPGSNGGITIPNAPYPVNDVTVFPAVFTLTATVAVLGQDQPLVVTRQTTVTMQPQLDILSFNASKTAVTGADGLQLSWQVNMATSITLSIQGMSGSVDVTAANQVVVTGVGTSLNVVDQSGALLGTLNPTQPVPPYLTFILTATAGSSTQRTVQVQVLETAVTSCYGSSRSWNNGCFRETDYYINWATVNAGVVNITGFYSPWNNAGPSGQLQGNYGSTATVTAQGFGYTVSRSSHVP